MTKELVLASAFRAELVFALDLIEEAGRRAVKYFESGVSVDAKEDGSPVTRADKDIEHMIREAIEQTFPDDGILGEEEIEKKAFLKYQSEEGNKLMRRWIVDPIDGTYNFARGIPIFSTLMALEEGDEIVAGVVYNPVLKDLYWAEKGKGAFKNGERIHVSEVDTMSEALFNFGGPDRIMKVGLWDGFTELIKRTCRQRGFGDYLGFSFVFEGKAEAMLETGVKPWDLAPMKIIVEEAGGTFVDLAGGTSVYQGGCIVSNKKLAHEFKRILLPNV
ncbi:hypothetical protein KF728_10120 [Candidatus Obscuribacterales bacterium]|nr:hypothetical protein [Candidatus Obscuribacterales bacterium]